MLMHHVNGLGLSMLIHSFFGDSVLGASRNMTINLLTSIERILSAGSINPRCIHLGIVTRA